MNTEHDHHVAFYEGNCDSGSWLQSASLIERTSYMNLDGERFSFCPDCGASLAAFWREVDEAREAHRLQMEREERDERRRRAREAEYSNTPPT